MLAAALAAAGALAGITGTWSPCGFSAVETIGAAGRRRTLAAACASFAAGALAGAVATFVALAAVGGEVPSSVAVIAAAAVASAAALAEAAGVRIVPQVRRQVPESWRRRLPLPVASAGYGVLLGLGFTTFVYTLAFWALAAIALVLGDVRLGLAAGLGFGVGRALPIVALAPVARRPLGRDVLDAMAMRPWLLRGLRVLDAGALSACAAALLAGGASAAAVVARAAADPSAERGVVAWEGASGSTLRYDLGSLGGAASAHHVGPLDAPLPGADPAVGGGLVAWREGDLVRVVRRSDFAPVTQVAVPRANALAVSAHWLAYRTSGPRGDRLAVRRLPAAKTERVVAAAAGATTLGRPSLDGDGLVFHVDSPRASRIVFANLVRGRTRTVRRSRAEQLTNPSLAGGRLLYVRVSSTAQRLERGLLDRPATDRPLARAGPTALRDRGYEPGHSRVTRTPTPRRSPTAFWTTALAPRSAYLTLLPPRGGLAGSRILRIPLGAGGSRPRIPPGIEIGTAPPAPVLAYTASSRSQDALVLVGGDGVEQVLATAGRLEDPAWSPDGTRVAFAGPRGLYVLGLGGGSPVEITRGRTDSDPDWSPDGTTIAFVRGDRIYSVAAGGGRVRRLTSGRGRDQEPAWSPDGSRLAFASRRRGNWDLYTVDLAGRERRLTRTRAAEGFPSWSPDAAALAFDRRTAAGMRIFTLRLAGGPATRITSSPGDDFHPAWSADGARIAFVGDRDGRPRIYAAPATGGPAVPLGVAPGLDDAPDWRPPVG